MESAKTAAEDAQAAADQAGGAAQAAESAKEAAQTARTGAETAQEAIEDMEVDSITLAAGEPASVEKTAAEGHVKLVFGLPTGKQGPQGQKGSSIENIERTAGNGAVGTVDTYTITMSDGSTYNFQVYNGMDGMGAGDMLKEVYDPQGKSQDIFAYAAGLAANKQDKITGTTDQVVGFDADGKPTPVSKEDLKGSVGKTAYQYAVDGGYTGTEEEFQELMGTGPWLPLSGGTVSGDIVLAPYKNIVSSQDNLIPTIRKINNVPVFGFYVSSNFGANNGFRLQGVATPIYAGDAANKAYVDSVASGVPTGVIVMWSGAANAIPSGWLLCNGQNGTPDLRDRFIVGAGNSYSVGSTGGSNSVTLTVEQMPSHAHSIGVDYLPDAQISSSSSLRVRTRDAPMKQTINETGGSQPHENRPPYYALCFITKQ